MRWGDDAGGDHPSVPSEEEPWAHRLESPEPGNDRLSEHHTPFRPLPPQVPVVCLIPPPSRDSAPSLEREGGRKEKANFRFWGLPMWCAICFFGVASAASHRCVWEGMAFSLSLSLVSSPETGCGNSNSAKLINTMDTRVIFPTPPMVPPPPPPLSHSLSLSRTPPQSAGECLFCSRSKAPELNDGCSVKIKIVRPADGVISGAATKGRRAFGCLRIQDLMRLSREMTVRSSSHFPLTSLRVVYPAR